MATKHRLLLEETTERTERTTRRVWVESPPSERPRPMSIDASGDTIPEPKTLPRGPKPAMAKCGNIYPLRAWRAG